MRIADIAIQGPARGGVVAGVQFIGLRPDMLRDGGQMDENLIVARHWLAGLPIEGDREPIAGINALIVEDIEAYQVDAAFKVVVDIVAGGNSNQACAARL